MYYARPPGLDSPTLPVDTPVAPDDLRKVMGVGRLLVLLDRDALIAGAMVHPTAAADFDKPADVVPWISVA